MHYWPILRKSLILSHRMDHGVTWKHKRIKGKHKGHLLLTGDYYYLLKQWLLWINHKNDNSLTLESIQTFQELTSQMSRLSKAIHILHWMTAVYNNNPPAILRPLHYWFGFCVCVLAFAFVFQSFCFPLMC